jgi:hypothetical protein
MIKVQISVCSLLKDGKTDTGIECGRVVGFQARVLNRHDFPKTEPSRYSGSDEIPVTVRNQRAIMLSRHQLASQLQIGVERDHSYPASLDPQRHYLGQ